MSIESQFNSVAEEYDKNRKLFIPCYDDFYGNTTKLIASNIEEPKRILDLGAGTGLLSKFWLMAFPKSEFILVDIADEMLKIAKKRFIDYKNVSFEVLDYTQNLPEKKFDIIISALSIHHLENIEKKSLFKKIYKSLSEKGVFINYDQFFYESKKINSWINKYWEKQLATSELSSHDIDLWRERKKFDRECSVNQEIEMLYDSGFLHVENVYTYEKFSVILSVK